MRRGGRGGARQRARALVEPSPFNDPSGGGRRDSDASICSSRPSSAGGRSLQASNGGILDRSSHASALRSVNAYLSSLSASFSLKPPYPSARDITDCLRLLFSRLDLEIGLQIDDDVLLFLRLLGCPVKINRSAFRAPGTPHAWPCILSVLYWLVQSARYSDHLSSIPPPPRLPNDLNLYTFQSYALFLGSPDDEAIADLDKQFIDQTEHSFATTAASVDELEKEASLLEDKAKRLRSGPSKKVDLERVRDVLVEDHKKFESVVESYNEQVKAMKGKLTGCEKALEAEEMENKRICEENEELKRRIDGQAVSPREVERMRRELQAVEREIWEADNTRNTSEEKAWELESEIRKKWKDIEAMTVQCNQAMGK